MLVPQRVLALLDRGARADRTRIGAGTRSRCRLVRLIGKLERPVAQELSAPATRSSGCGDSSLRSRRHRWPGSLGMPRFEAVSDDDDVAAWWNSGGVYFLSLLGGIAAVAFVASLVARPLARFQRRRAVVPPTTVDLAYLAGGFDRAALACVVGLYRKGAVNRGPMLTLDVTGPLPAGAPAMMTAIHARLREPCGWLAVLADPHVRAAAAGMHSKLVRRGFLASDARRRWARLTTIPLWAVVGLGLVRLVWLVSNRAEAANGPTAGVVVVTVAAAIAGWMLLPAPWITTAGREALRVAAADLRETERRREAGRGPSARELMRAIAVRGPADLVAADPAFGDAVGAHRPLRPAPRQHIYSWEKGRWNF